MITVVVAVVFFLGGDVGGSFVCGLLLFGLGGGGVLLNMHKISYETKFRS